MATEPESETFRVVSCPEFEMDGVEILDPYYLVPETIWGLRDCHNIARDDRVLVKYPGEKFRLIDRTELEMYFDLIDEEFLEGNNPHKHDKI